MGVLEDAATSAPDVPGVYLMFDRSRRLLYVGKAGHLNRRLGQHAVAARKEATPRDGARRDLVAEVQWEVHGDAASAASREADLIVAFAPPLNGSTALDGRWTFLKGDAAGDVRRFRLDAAPLFDGALYGCFTHLGVGVGTMRGIACSEGYPALLRLLWAATDEDPRARHPRAISGSSPPTEACVRLSDEWMPGLHRFLTGVGPAVVGLLLDRIVATGVRPVFMLPALRRDCESARAFFEHGPQAIRAIRLRHGLAPGPVDRPTLVALWTSELTAQFGPFELVPLDDPARGALGGRFGRSASLSGWSRGRRIGSNGPQGEPSTGERA
jgi:predicted GIY-YIG superfamily endonuclease